MSGKFGPSGGKGGNTFDAPPPSEGQWRINTVEGKSGSRIDQIELIWVDQNGGTHSSKEFGEGGGSSFSYSIGSGDYLTQINGSVGHHNGSLRLYSIQFHTQEGLSSEEYGSSTSEKFEYQCPEGYQIVGIFGRSGDEVDALGVYIDKM